MILLQKLLDPNTYATKKTLAQGMLDIALLSASASQLRYALEVGTAQTWLTSHLHQLYHSRTRTGAFGLSL